MVESARRLADSVGLTLTARLSILVCASCLPIALGVGAWTAKRAVAFGDQALASIARLETQQALLAQAVKLQAEAGAADRAGIRTVLGKYDDRIRLLELGSLERRR